jgi:hypothetical protein
VVVAVEVVTLVVVKMQHCQVLVVKAVVAKAVLVAPMGLAQYLHLA